VRKGLKVLLALQVHKGRLALQVVLAHKDLLVRLVRKEQLDLPDPLVLRVPRGQLVLKERKAR
jgi:hypothetical protein